MVRFAFRCTLRLSCMIAISSCGSTPPTRPTEPLLIDMSQATNAAL